MVLRTSKLIVASSSPHFRESLSLGLLSANQLPLPHNKRRDDAERNRVQRSTANSCMQHVLVVGSRCIALTKPCPSKARATVSRELLPTIFCGMTTITLAD